MTALYILCCSSVFWNFSLPLHLFSCPQLHPHTHAHTPTPTLNHTFTPNWNFWAQHTHNARVTVAGLKIHTSWFCLERFAFLVFQTVGLNLSGASEDTSHPKDPTSRLLTACQRSFWGKCPKWTICQRKRYLEEAILTAMSKLFLIPGCVRQDTYCQIRDNLAQRQRHNGYI